MDVVLRSISLKMLLKGKYGIIFYNKQSVNNTNFNDIIIIETENNIKYFVYFNIHIYRFLFVFVYYIIYI